MPQIVKYTRTHQGDTLVEVLFAMTVFAAVAVGAMAVMNRGINAAQTSLETTQVRNEIDSQAELLRHLHAAKLSSASGLGTSAQQQAAHQWDIMTKQLHVAQAGDYGRLASSSECTFGDNSHKASNTSMFVAQADQAKAFFIDPATGKVISYGAHPDYFAAADTYAQVRPPENTVRHSVSNMLWVQAVRVTGDLHGVQGQEAALTSSVAYDFHIRACWPGVGLGARWRVQGTIVRLYMPKGVE